MSKILKEPLFHFLLIGALIFMLYQKVGKSQFASSGEIVVTKSHIQRLVDNWSRVWKRPPTPEEYKGILEEYIKEEVFYREALAMGLDQDDTIIRRRLRQKMEFISEDLSLISEPTENELKSYFTENKEKFIAPPRITFEQKFEGKSSVLPEFLENATRMEVDSQFGNDFFDQITKLPMGEWVGPIESGFGSHQIFVHSKEIGGDVQFETVRADVQAEWEFEQKARMNELFTEKLRTKYDITIESYP